MNDLQPTEPTQRVELENENVRDTNLSHNHPKWLRRLERESWQAELIVSGLAIYGSFKLPDIVFWFIDYLITHLAMEHYFMGYMLSYILLLGFSALTTFFIIHFILRGYWIGLIGLNSVYPNGYKSDGGFYSPFFMEKMIGYLPSIRESIKKIDNICSTLFAGACGFVMIYSSMALMLGLLLALANILDDYIHPQLAILPLYIWLGLSLLVTIMGMLSVSKKFKSNEAFQNRYFKISKTLGNIMIPVLYKPANQIMMTFYSYFEKKQNMLQTLVLFGFATIYSTFLMNKSNMEVLINGEDHFVRLASTDVIRSTFYLDQLKDHSKTIQPVIPSELIEGPLMRLFIPLYASEKRIRKTICGEFQKDKNLEWDENWMNKRAFNSACYKQYIKVSVNGTAYDLDMPYHKLSHKNEAGVLTYVPTENFNIGRNELIVRKLKNKEGDIDIMFKIPFWFNGKG